MLPWLQYGILISWHSKSAHKEKQQRKENNIIQIKRTVEDMNNQDITFVIDFEQNVFDVYMNGVLVTRDLHDEHSFKNITCVPCIPFTSMKQVNAQISYITSLTMPSNQPGRR